ncbi:Rossmann-fold NAD(P)-binding domain-containing protein [Mariniluteicoccus flavus]
MTGPLTVAVTDINLPHLAEELDAAMPPGTRVRWLNGASGDELLAGLADADVLAGPVLTAEMAEAAPGLRLMQVVGAGVDGVDRAALRPGVVLANTFHHEDAMAEYAVWASVGLRRGLERTDRALRQGTWLSPAQNSDVPSPAGWPGPGSGCSASAMWANASGARSVTSVLSAPR